VDEELKPCPFGGERAIITTAAAGFVVHCDNDDCGAFGGLFDVKANAIAAWNRRTGADQ